MKGISRVVRLLLLLTLLLMPLPGRSDDFSFHAPASADDRTTPDVMRDLAERVLPVYQEPEIERYLANLSMLQLAAGNYKAAYDSRQSLRDRRHDQDAGRPVSRALLIDLYAHAKAIETGNATPFAQAFTQSYREEVPQLGDLDAYAVTGWLGASPDGFRAALQAALDRARTKESLSLDDAIELLRTWMFYDAYRSFAPVVGNLIADENGRRYLVAENLLIHTRSGIDLQARWIRPKTVSKPLPTLLEFTILAGAYDDPRACAAHGYVCVVAWTRGSSETGTKRDYYDPVVPFEHDGEDAKAAIDWITHQPWSDGRVGMVGEGYSGFTAWAASRQHPAALKAIATSDAIAPGVDFPTSGQIFRNRSYRWAIENTEPATKLAMDDAAWNALDLSWYRSGKPYRDLDRLAELPSLIFRRWLNHPSYDRYWQKMIPSGPQFGKIDIPVLSISGYYADGSIGSLFYFNQLAKHAKSPNQTLLLGPWDDAAIRSGSSSQLQGYAFDPAALVDLHELRFQWLDHVFKNSPLPPQLVDRVNYEVMGANEWRHAASLAAMSDSTLKFYLDGTVAAGLRHLAEKKPAHAKSSPLTVRLADRSDATLPLPAPGILGKSLAGHDRLIYVSGSVKSVTELAGPLSGQLDFRINKMDMDLNLGLYEQLPDGQYLQLAAPCEFRASYARDHIHRHLLKAGERQQLDFHCEPIVSRRVQVGSRIALVLGISKRPDREINYGAGNDVSAESIDDGREPLKLQWFADSYIELPVKK